MDEFNERHYNDSMDMQIHDLRIAVGLAKHHSVRQSGLTLLYMLLLL